MGALNVVGKSIEVGIIGFVLNTSLLSSILPWIALWDEVLAVVHDVSLAGKWSVVGGIQGWVLLEATNVIVGCSSFSIFFFLFFCWLFDGFDLDRGDSGGAEK